MGKPHTRSEESGVRLPAIYRVTQAGSLNITRVFHTFNFTSRRNEFESLVHSCVQEILEPK